MLNQPPRGHRPVENSAAWGRLLIGLSLVFILFHGMAAWLGSDRGQFGLLVAAVVLAGIVATECWLFGADPGLAVRNLGLGVPRRRGIAAAILIAAGLWATIPVFTVVTGSDVRLAPGWLGFVPGLFAQAGIAEETLFRAYLFGHLRASRRFWPAAALSLLPFVAVHLPLFLTMESSVAAAALLLAAATAIPFARLYELGGGTIWAPAIVHTVIQGTVKVVAVPDEWTLPFVLSWMMASAVLPFAAFAVRRPAVAVRRPGLSTRRRRGHGCSRPGTG